MSIEKTLDELAKLGVVTHVSLWPTDSGQWQANFATSRSGEKFSVFHADTPSAALSGVLEQIKHRAPYDKELGAARSTRLVTSPQKVRSVRDLI